MYLVRTFGPAKTWSVTCYGFAYYHLHIVVVFLSIIQHFNFLHSFSISNILSVSTTFEAYKQLSRHISFLTFKAYQQHFTNISNCEYQQHYAQHGCARSFGFSEFFIFTFFTLSIGSDDVNTRQTDWKWKGYKTLELIERFKIN